MTAPTIDPAAGPPAEATEKPGQHANRWSDLVVTGLAIVVALVIGGILIAMADPQTRNAAGYFFQWPFDTFGYGAQAAWNGYVALFQGAFFNPRTAANGTLVGYLGPISETLVNATPLILGGLSVGLAFRAGLFNIGGQGQIILGAIFGTYVGFAWNLPPVIHLVVAVLAAALGGALWGGLVGWLKARTGAHEVITTIMLNYVAAALLAYLLSVAWFQAPPFGQAISRKVDTSAQLPPLLGSTMRVHLGLVLALLAAWGVWWLLERSVLGFRLKAVGANQFASRTAGMSVERSIIAAMVLAGALSGLAGACQALGTNTQITQDIDAGIGFDAITVALLGRAKPVGIVWAGLLFGALHAGGVQLQSVTGTPIDLVQVIQSLIVLFIAAPAVVRAIFRIRTSGMGVGQALAKGWNG